MSFLRPIATLGAIAFVLAAIPSGAIAKSGDEKPQVVVDGAVTVLKDFAADDKMTWFRDHVQSAEAIVIVPSLVKAGFIFGASGGNAVVMTRKARSWSHPAFYTMGSASFGLQAGVQDAQVILLVMTEKGRNALLSNKFQLGADASVAAGPVGGGAQAATSDILSFSRAQGIFGGLSIEGAVISVRDGYNGSYYSEGTQPVDILVTRNKVNKGAEKLRVTAAEVAGR